MKRIYIMFLGLLFVGTNVFAAGDLIVNGKLGVGNGSAPGFKVDVTSTDATSVNINAVKNTGAWINGTFIKTEINSPDASANNLLVYPTHYATSSTHGSIKSAIFNAGMLGSGDIDFVTGLQNQIGFNSLVGDYNVTEIRGNEAFLGINAANTGNHTVTDYTAFMSYGNTAGSGSISGTNWRHAHFKDFPDFGGTITNVTGLWIDKQTTGLNNYGIVLNGHGTDDSNDSGAAIVFGPSQSIKLYSKSDGKLYVNDGSVVTQISPHDPETDEWIFYSKNLKTGKTVRVNMEKLVKAVEKLTGETFMFETLIEDK